jgi:hypothetical protein
MTGTLPLWDVASVEAKLAWMRKSHIWPNGRRYLWTDAFGVVLLASLARELHEDHYLDEAEWVVAEVERVLGRTPHLQSGEEPGRECEYFHCQAMWLFALARLGAVLPRYRAKAVALARDNHPAFVIPDTGVIWKLRDDQVFPYPDFGMGALDPFFGLVIYRLLDPVELAPEIAELERVAQASRPAVTIAHDLGLGMMLWLSHFAPAEPWAVEFRARALHQLDEMWINPPGYFCRVPWKREMKFAFTNFGVSLGLQAVGASADRVRRLNAFFGGYRSGDAYDADAITHVMNCTSHFPGEFLRAPWPEG